MQAQGRRAPVPVPVPVALERRRLSELSEQASLLCARLESLLDRACARGRPVAAEERRRLYRLDVERHERVLEGLRASVRAAEAAELEAAAPLPPPLGLLPPQLLGRVAAEGRRGARPACRALLAAHDASVAALRGDGASRELTPQRVLGLPMLASLSVRLREATSPAALLRAASAGCGRLRALRLELWTPELSDAIAPALAQLTGLETLRLEHDRSPTPCTGALVRALGALSALTDLELEVASDAAAFAPALAALPRLRRLAVSDSDATALALLRPPAPALAQLRTLELGTCGIRDGDAVAALAAALGRLPGLQHLVLDSDRWSANGNRLSGRGAAALAPALRALADLRSLRLESCDVHAAAAAALAPAIGALTRLTLLSLSSNGIGDPGAAALAPALAGLAELRVLRIDHCGVSDAGAEALAAALPRMARLRTVRLDGNLLKTDGRLALALVAARHPSMEEMHVLDAQQARLAQELTRLLGPREPGPGAPARPGRCRLL